MSVSQQTSSTASQQGASAQQSASAPAQQGSAQQQSYQAGQTQMGDDRGRRYSDWAML